MPHRVVVQLLFFPVLAVLGVQPALAQNPPVTIQVDLTQGVHPINPNIYGVNNSDAATLNALNSPINRYGGNRTSRYNWQQNVDSTASDFFFESFPDAPTPGGIADFFVTNSRNANAQPMITVPMIDFIAKTDAQRNVLCSFSIAKYGPQTGNDAEFRPDCGNGIIQDGPPPVFVMNDPLDANTPNSTAFQQGLVQHLVDTFGTAANGGVRYYVLDNEHAIWHQTHRDVHPIGASSNEIRDKMIAFASMIRNVDPGALVVGPEEFGYTGYFLSGLDIYTCDIAQAMGDFTCYPNPPDRPNRGGMDYVAYLLTQLRAAEIMTGRRLLDVFSLHYYPQGNGVFGGATDNATQDLRSRSSRSLWDPTYVDESFIADAFAPPDNAVRLIPRMREWVNTFYPGTAIAVTEYNWSAASHINGGTTQADILGIFGREGLDLATLFTDGSLPLATFTAKAFQIYRNYDGQKSTFGDVSVRTTASDTAPEPAANHVGAYGAMRTADGTLTLMVVSKYRAGDTPVQVSLAGFQPGAMAEVWRLSAANGGAITRLADVPVGASFNLTVPAQSVTLLVLRPQNATPDFMLSCVPGTVTVALGGTVTTACTVLPMLGYTGITSLGCANRTGVTCSFGLNPVPAGGTTTLTIQAAADVAPNAYTITITGIGDPFIRQTTLGVTVSATGPPPPPSSSPTLALQLNQNTFRTGQEFVLRATLTPGTTPVTVDAYVLVRLPGGSMLSLTLGGGIVPGVVPIARGLPATNFSGELLRYRFAGTEPVGSYAVTGALAVAGTGNVIGAIAERPFTFGP
jgi:hypothetical protein